MKKGIVNFSGSVVSLFEFSLNYKGIISLCMLVFAAIGLGLGFLQVPYYKSDMFVSHIRFDNDYCKEMINDLNNGIYEANGNLALARKLKLSKADACQIKEIRYMPLSEQVAKRFADSTSVMLPFRVEVEVYSNEVLDTLQQSIIAYLENNDYATKRKNFEKEALDKIETRLDKEISNLDSLKRLIEKSVVPQSTGNGIILGQPINPVLVYDAATKLYEKKIDINKKQGLNNSFNLMVGFSESYKKEGSGKLVPMLSGALIGYLIGLAIAARRARRARLVNN